MSLETPARVVRLEGDTAWVLSESPGSCGACGGKGCGASLFSRVWQSGNASYPVDNPIGAQAGEAVVVGLPEGSLLAASVSAYLIPLAGLLGGALAGNVLAGEPAALAGGLLGLLGAGLWLRGARFDATRQPVILRRGEHVHATSCKAERPHSHP